jgi:hypothetical protein
MASLLPVPEWVQDWLMQSVTGANGYMETKKKSTCLVV